MDRFTAHLICFYYFFVIAIAAKHTPYSECFTRVTRRAVDNYRPLAEFQQISLSNCMQRCLTSVSSNHQQEAKCESFTYDVQLRLCKTYDHDGYKIPAIVHPVLGTDHYTRKNAHGVCEGKSSAANSVNPNFVNLHAKNIPQDTARKHQKPFVNDITNFRTHAAPTLKNTRPLQIPVAHDDGCSSTGYYVVLGNEITLPRNGRGRVQAKTDVGQGECASLCSNNKGLLHGFKCSSLNYFPETRKCELYDILAEPHGPGLLSLNENVIYAEKFCIPESRRNCAEDEVFILHVQRSVKGEALGVTEASSITQCLRSCLNTQQCLISVFDSKEQKCRLHDVDVVADRSKVVDDEEGVVLIENGCTTSKQETLTNVLMDSEALSLWSDCSFRVGGHSVKVRTTPSGVLEMERC